MTLSNNLDNYQQVKDYINIIVKEYTVWLLLFLNELWQWRLGRGTQWADISWLGLGSN